MKKSFYTRFGKRFLDIVFGLLLAPFVLLIGLFVAVAIKLDDRGPIFYNAPRLGRYRKTFKMYKFRSMKVNAADIRNPDGSTFNAADDPRVTKVGRVLRKTSLDELPQIFNVIKGDMSFVGPRPSPLGNRYPDYALRKFDMRPGITGYNQAVLRNAATLDQRYHNDVYYVENCTFGLDVKIIVRTFLSVVKSENIYHGDDNKR